MDPEARIAAAATRIVAAGRAAWPDVVLDEAAIADRLRAQHAADPDASTDELHDADFYLASALAARDPAAVRAFEAKLVPEVDIALRRLRLPSGTADEVKQALRLELLAETEPKIADYAGRGALVGWLRVSATRKALKLARKGAAFEELDDMLLDHWPSPTPSPVNEHMRVQYTTELKRAIKDSFAALELRQRNLLRQHIIDELTIDDLARQYRVHRATCARWLSDARVELGKGTRKRLITALRMQSGEVESLMRFLDSDIELSISRILVAE
jgi:RNA polymerase sigma-70 factor (ECF subfamily)